MSSTVYKFLIAALLLCQLHHVLQLATASPIHAKRQSPSLLVGVGKADVTGPIGEITMGGYADLSQKANGIHLRLKARAFIFASQANPARRVVYVSTDVGWPSYRTLKMVVTSLRAKLSAADAALYSVENIMMSATHTHSGVGGYQDNFLTQVTNFGLTPGAREAIAEGISQAIVEAHTNFSPATVNINKGRLENASINRSPTAYLNNPASERAQYTDDVDRDMVLLSVKDPATGRLRGTVNWFAVHPVSMNASNHLVSGDNKGYASYLWELQQKAAGNPTFVGAFAQTNAGDVSANTEGAHCIDTGAPCDGGKDSCGGDITKCLGRGPGYEIGGDILSTEIIGKRQLDKAQQLTTSATKTLTGGVVDYRHSWVSLPDIKLAGETGPVCKAAMGYSFSAGTTDKPATGISWQGDNDPNASNKPFWNFVRNLLKPPSQELITCQAPKVILLATGEMTAPYDWQSNQLPYTLFLITRKLAIMGVPGEISTMSGRRMRAGVLAQLVADGTADADAEIIVSGLTNSYSSYITTKEEYQVQRYEGGSTAYGPNTLAAHVQVFKTLAGSFKAATVPPASPAFPVVAAPPNPNEVNFLTPVVLDTAPIGQGFGSVTVQPAAGPFKQGERVSAEFVCAHPRNGGSDAKTIVANGVKPVAALPGGAPTTFMTVERQVGASQWEIVLDDASWDTKYSWRRNGVAESRCIVEWKVGGSEAAAPGTYRLRYLGRAKTLFSTTSHSGATNAFVVAA
ncbi:Neutral/alkaline nonlysosomal ceramidase [Fimicolochytrium jonesii]|uniref:Neutral/alkaline nonlysosomal ceramidase n=1 Tax=Fimicolochytrium jonesii TaxID=1396493 RepID=UPI0022FDDF14|nr:Neutral/alkaline nonlysosomal ceramidase [Fimicolochytrium jonesii]KAI8818710.1 Neutral/alkaline nonlysosomal ceramidase [Fimicolochytrium jonesii]